MHSCTLAKILLAAALLLVTARAAGDEIVMRSAVRLAPGDTVVHLGDVAELAGPDAQRHADLVLLQLEGQPAAPRTVDVLHVRTALDGAGVHWGRVNLSGRQTIVRPAEGGAAAPLAMAPLTLSGDGTAVAVQDRVHHVAADLLGEPTLRGELAAAVVRGVGGDPGGLRLCFDDRSDAALARTTRDLRFEITPTTSFHSERLSFAVVAWRGGTVAERWSVRVDVEMRRPVAIAREQIHRGDSIAPGDVLVQERWVSPAAAATMADPAAAAGAIAALHVRAGQPLRRDDLEQPVLVRRGDTITVRCLVGGLAIAMKAEARSEGAIGETVELRKIGEREIFLATVTAAGEAVVDLKRR